MYMFYLCSIGASVEPSSGRPSSPRLAEMSLAGARDPWQREFNETRQLGDDCFLLLQERASQLQLNAAASVARLSAASRRKLNALNSKIDRLDATVAEETCACIAVTLVPTRVSLAPAQHGARVGPQTRHGGPVEDTQRAAG